MGIGNLFGLLGDTKARTVGTSPYVGNSTGIANDYATFGNGQRDTFDAFDPAYLQSVRDQSRALTDNPNTDSFNAGQLANRTGTTTAAYQAATANLQAEMARRGISGGGADIGGAATLAAGQAGQISGAAAQTAEEASMQHLRNLAANTSLLGGVANTAGSNYVSALAPQATIYNGLGDDWRQTQEFDANAEQQADTANNGQLPGLIGGAANIYGQFAGARRRSVGAVA